MASRTTLAQWRMLQAVVDHGGFNQAAAALHRSASSINHAVHKLQDQLGLQLLKPEGRRVVLTQEGQVLLARARLLLEEAALVEETAKSLAQGVEGAVRLAVDQIFPWPLLQAVLTDFARQWPKVQVALRETVLSGGVELLYAGEVDLLVTGVDAQGFLGIPLLNVRFVCVAHPQHPLHQLGADLSLRDLKYHRQLVIRDSAISQRQDAGWLKAGLRWTVTNLQTSLQLLQQGVGFAWLPEQLVSEALQQGRLKVLPLAAHEHRQVALQLVQADPDAAGPATRCLVQMLQDAATGSSQPGKH